MCVTTDTQVIHLHTRTYILSSETSYESNTQFRVYANKRYQVTLNAINNLNISLDVFWCTTICVLTYDLGSPGT